MRLHPGRSQLPVGHSRWDIPAGIPLLTAADFVFAAPPSPGNPQFRPVWGAQTHAGIPGRSRDQGRSQGMVEPGSGIGSEGSRRVGIHRERIFFAPKGRLHTRNGARGTRIPAIRGKRPQSQGAEGIEGLPSLWDQGAGAAGALAAVPGIIPDPVSFPGLITLEELHQQVLKGRGKFAQDVSQ